MLNFKRIELSDKKLIESYFSKSNVQLCDYSFSNLFLWSSLYGIEWAEAKGFLIIRYYYENSYNRFYLQPIGKSSIKNILDLLLNESKKEKAPLRFAALSESFLKEIKKHPQFPALFSLNNRDYSNYVYSATALSTLSGKALHSKKNHINKFQRLYSDFSSRPLDANDAHLALALFDNWEKHKEHSIEFDIERKSLKHIFSNYQALKLKGLLLLVDNEPIAFTLGSELNKDTFCIHIEKANIAYHGSFAMINYLMANTLVKKYKFINREEDLGIENLRKAKLSYKPELLVPHYQAIELNSVEAAVWDLWKTCFGDSDEFIFSYLSFYSTSKTRVLIFEKKDLVAMFHLHFFKSSWSNKVAYLYGLGTAPIHRGKGFASQVIQKSLEKAKQQGALVAWVIQANKDFNRWQTQFDFSPFGDKTLSFQSPNQFDFGGDTVNDWGLCRILNPKEYLEIYYRQHPLTQVCFYYQDPLFEELNGYYKIDPSGVHFKAQACLKKHILKSQDLLRLFPLKNGTDLEFILPKSKNKSKV